MRRIIYTLIATCLIASTMSAQRTANPIAQQAAATGLSGLPFEDDFSSGLSKWTSVQGPWKVEGGMLKCDPSAASSLICTGDATWGNYTCSAKIRSVNNASIGFVLRYGDLGNYYVVRVFRNRTEVWATNAGVQRLVHRYQRVETYGVEGEVDLASWHDITVSVSGAVPMITVYIDGWQESSVKDLAGPQLSHGKVGFYTGGDSLLEVDSVKVEAAGPKVAGGFSVLILLVEFPDVRHVSEPQRIYNDVFMTLNRYFTEVSYNLTWVAGQVVSHWKMLQKPSTYYDIADVTGSGWQKDTPIEFLRDAIELWDDEVDYSKYDCIFVAAANQSVWGFTIVGADIAHTNDGVNITRCVGLREASPWTTYAHEFGHIMGLPDLYSFQIAFSGPSDYREAAVYVGPWDLMSRSDERPQIGAWGKIKLGWVSEARVRECTAGQQLLTVLRPLEQSPSIQDASPFTQAIIVWTSDTTYFVVENRQLTGFDAVLPEGGVLVSYVDEDRFSFGNGVEVVQDSHPQIGPRWRLPHPVFDIGSGEVDQLVNVTYNVAIVVLDKQNDSYIIAVCNPSSISTARSAYAAFQQAEEQVAIAEGRNYNTSRARDLVSSAELRLEEAHEALGNVGSNIFEQAITKSNECMELLSEAQSPEGSNQVPWVPIMVIACVVGILALAVLPSVRRALARR